ncbi:MAG: extracellular solute-binding protein [Patescibacteria group bacterium]
MPTRRFFRFLSLVSCLLSLVLILSACTHSRFFGQKEEQITLEYWGLWESPTVMTVLINDYKATHPNINISYKKRAREQYRETLEAQIQTGKGPDIFRFHNTWTPMLKEELAPAPASIIPSSDFKKDFYSVANSDLKIAGKVVGVPLGLDGLALYYNEDIFKAAGITKPPATWTEFAQTAAKLTVRDTAGNIRTAGAAIGTASNVDHFSDIAAVMIMQNGGELKSPTDKQSIDAVDYYTKFAKGQNRVWDETMPASTVAFAGGNLAMYFGPSWRAIEFKNANPLLKFKTVPIPQLEGGKVTWASYWAEGVSTGSAHQQEAWKFLKYLSSEEVLVKFYSEAAKSPGRFFGEPYPRVTMAAKLATDPIVGAYISQAPFARSFPMATRTFDNGLNDQIIKAYEDAINSIGKGTATKSALETVAKNITSIINRYNASPQ